MWNLKHEESLYALLGLDVGWFLFRDHDADSDRRPADVQLPSNLVDDLRKLINNPAFADVTFVVENQSVYATRAHLAARSEHFRALFYGGMRESSDAEEQIVLQDVAHPVFLLLLEYIYTDQVGEISSELAVHLLIAAERFLLDRLKVLGNRLAAKSVF
ncbi:ARIA [Symbiodinium necroappetens]|uniref:ARIA protein n=1 Tax=Symbiodinium necroappetens TaxID=1628268 RepID=A0A812JLS0_9DINO|nr:ARIA [Symbiodinium necroappetens]